MIGRSVCKTTAPGACSRSTGCFPSSARWAGSKVTGDIVASRTGHRAYQPRRGSGAGADCFCLQAREDGLRFADLGACQAGAPGKAVLPGARRFCHTKLCQDVRGGVVEERLDQGADDSKGLGQRTQGGVEAELRALIAIARLLVEGPW